MIGDILSCFKAAFRFPGKKTPLKTFIGDFRERPENYILEVEFVNGEVKATLRKKCTAYNDGKTPSEKGD